MKKQDILKGIEADGLNFVGNNFNKMKKEQLKEICLAYMNALKEADKKALINYENFMAFDDLKMNL